MRLAYPYVLILLLMIVPLFLYSTRSGGRIRFSGLDIIKSLKSYRSFNPRSILLILRALVLALFIFAMARPQSGKKFTEVKSEGIDIMLLIDTSGSMQALDFKRDGKRFNRLEIVKKVVRDFIDKRAGDRLGLIVFGDEAFTQCPLTLDHGILVDLLEKLEIGMAGGQTAIGSAIGIGVNRIKDLEAKSKILVLLTDGENTAGRIDPLKAAQLAKIFGVKVYTIGVGTNGKAPFEQQTFFGKSLVYQNVRLDEKTLQTIASETGGSYFRASNTEQLQSIYEQIDKLEKTEVEVKEYTEYEELFHFFLIPGLLLLLFEIVLGQTRLRKIP